MHSPRWKYYVATVVCLHMITLHPMRIVEKLECGQKEIQQNNAKIEDMSVVFK